MLQYILNATAIWLLSLIVFDVFLRRESFHNYNRAYLLATLLLGALLPLWQWQEATLTPLTTGIKPVAQVLAAKRSIVAAAPVADTRAGTTTIPWLAIVYLSGVAVAFALLLVDIIRLASFYRRGTSSLQNGWTVVETRKDHAPFSFRHTLFVNTIVQYSGEEWSMILQHERRHTALLHIADLALLQLARIVFWFHPLVYIYQRRTLLVHEYQADGAGAKQTQAYGRFLVEQAILQSAPALSHSFNRSPIKKRLVMLTHHSSTIARIKMIVFVPVVAVCAVCFSKNSFAQKFQRHGNKVTYRGNTFEYNEPKYDTIRMTNPDTHQAEETVIRLEPIPIKFNGKKLCTTDDVTTQPEPTTKYKRIENHLLNGLNSEFEKLPDGAYILSIDNIVLDDMGKVIYYEYGEFTTKSKAPAPPEDIKKAIESKIEDLMLSAPVYKPAKVNGKAVAIRTDIFLNEYKIEVTNHRVSLWQRTF